MKKKPVTVGGLEIPFTVGDEYFTISEPDADDRYTDHFKFGVEGPETVEGILIDADGIYVGDSEELFYPLIEVFKTREEAEELIKLLGIDKLPFAENDAVNSPKGDDTIAALSIDYDRRKLIIHTDKGYNFTLEEWGESVTPR